MHSEQINQLGQHLISSGKVSSADFQRALGLLGDGQIESLLVKMGLVSERDVADALAEQSGLQTAMAADFPEAPIMDERLSAKFLRHHQVLPLSSTDDEVVVAVTDPYNDYVTNALRMSAGRTVTLKLGLPSEIDSALEKLYGTGRSQMDQIVEGLVPVAEAAQEEDVAHLKDLASEAPVIRLVNLILQRAVEIRASDIHIEPFEQQLKVRYRVDGMLREEESPPARFYAAVISRVKIMAKLDIAERRLPQDGRLKIHALGNEIDLRVSTVPTMHGESVVMRLLYKDNAAMDFNSLGFDNDIQRVFQDVLSMPHGILLVTGPTGSGKTTTLYASLNVLNETSRKILTVEDPVEYQIEGINQIQVKPQIGLTFANALRAIVRQDPDVIMIGEMRDYETAEIAVQSALTGHMVLSTLHTNDAASSITRLQDMGVEGYLVTSVVNGVLAQRLVRVLCEHCRESYQALPELVHEARLDQFTGSDEVTLFRPKGCEQCNGTGFTGRTAIIEMLRMTDAIRELVLEQAGNRAIAAKAIEEGMRTMYEDGLQKALSGVTSIEEVLRVTRDV